MMGPSSTGAPAAETLATPPTPPGSLTSPPRSREVLSFLDALRRWRDDLSAALGRLDRRAQVASRPDDYLADVQLAMSLTESIDRRTEELIAAWDSGRVGPDELAKIAELIWGRLPDALGNPTAFALSEASTLAAALESRLSARLSADTIAGSGAAGRIAPLRETLQRCRQLVETLGAARGHADTEADRLAAGLEKALNSAAGPAAAGAEIDRIADAAEILERDLIKEVGLRSVVQREAVELADRVAAIERIEAEVHVTADRCRDKIADPPRLGIPEVHALGAVPQPPANAAGADAWQRARAEQAAYAARLDLVARALDEAARRYAAPLDERAELRGLAEAYRARAGAAGLAEDPQLDKGFAAARTVLYQAPCDLAAGRDLVTAYVSAVQRAVGSTDAPKEPPVPHVKPDSASTQTEDQT